MINSIGSSSTLRSPMPQSQPLTDEQKETVNSILSNYDSSNMTTENVESLKAEFNEAGIKPSEDLKGILEEAGFEVPERPGPQGAKGKGKPPEFSKLMEKLGASDISEEEIQLFIENIQNEKGKFSGSIMDEYA
ncbi:MAG: hypothetical protein OQJ81_09980 [Melioribacteraceae bacterium]|nr:hypothetical protein [Melioribacteraceae bacterium]